MQKKPYKCYENVAKTFRKLSKCHENHTNVTAALQMSKKCQTKHANMANAFRKLYKCHETIQMSREPYKC